MKINPTKHESSDEGQTEIIPAQPIYFPTATNTEKVINYMVKEEGMKRSGSNLKVSQSPQFVVNRYTKTKPTNDQD